MRIIPLLILIISALPSIQAEASHSLGAEMWYECLNQCTIRVHVIAYRDCAGINQMNFWEFKWESGSGCTNPSAVGNWVPGSGSTSSSFFVSEITSLCPGSQSQCSNSSVVTRGIEEWYRYRDYNVCSLNCGTYELIYKNVGRSPAATNIPQIQGQDQTLSLRSLKFDTSGAYCNSSPQFHSYKHGLLCSGQVNTIPFGATDPEGDSLSYKLGKCYQGNGNQLVYNPGFSHTQPLGNQWDVEVDPYTGLMTLKPKSGPTMAAVVCVIVEEWRNGVKINEISRDIQINIQNCQNPASELQTQYISPVITDTANNLTTCVDSLKIAVSGKTATFQQHLFLEGANPFIFLLDSNGQKQDTISGNSPSGMLVFVIDSIPSTESIILYLAGEECPYMRMLGKSFRVNPMPCFCPQIQVDQTCDTVQFSVSGHQNASLSWTGDGGLDSNANNTDSIFTHVYPQPPSVWDFKLTLIDTNLGCPLKYMGSVSTLRDKLIDNQGDSVKCDSLPFIFGPYASAASYTWPDGSSASTYSVSDGDSVWVTGIDTTGCPYLSDTFVFYVDTIKVEILGDSILCNKPEVKLWSSHPMDQYSWSTGDSTDTILVSQGGNISLLAWNEHGCEFQTEKFTVHEIQKPSNLDFTSIITKDSITAWSWQIANDSLIQRYEWLLGDGDTAYGDTVWHRYDSGSTYNLCLRIYYAEDCSFQKCRQIFLDVNHIESIKESGIEVYPNPANTHLNIRNKSKRHVKFSFYSSDGRLIRKGILKPGTTRLNLNGLPEGLYFLRSLYENHHNSRKILLRSND